MFLYVYVLLCTVATGQAVECGRSRFIINGSCYPCHLGCEVCTHSNSRLICTLCLNGFFLSGNLCAPCPKHCLNCLSHNVCKDCDTSCLPCPAKCVSCLSDSNCTLCLPGYYGDTCEKKCSEGCIDNKCEKTLGFCQCKHGWYEQDCNYTCPNSCISCFSDSNCEECQPGHYGSSCEKKCSEGCMDNICHKLEGHCQCKDGWYGQNCTSKCPEHCKHCFSSSSCDECRPGFYGLSCEHECPFGKYGSTCEEDCPSFCKERACNKSTGSCVKGCLSVMFGDKCDRRCPLNCKQCNSEDTCQICHDGYWGTACNSSCSDSQAEISHGLGSVGLNTLISGACFVVALILLLLGYIAHLRRKLLRLRGAVLSEQDGEQRDIAELSNMQAAWSSEKQQSSSQLRVETFAVLDQTNIAYEVPRTEKIHADVHFKDDEGGVIDIYAFAYDPCKELTSSERYSNAEGRPYERIGDTEQGSVLRDDQPYENLLKGEEKTRDDFIYC